MTRGEELSGETKEEGKAKRALRQISSPYGEATDALTRRGEDRIANGRSYRRHAHLACSTGPLGAVNDVNIDNGRSVFHAEDFVVVEVALDHAATGNGYLTH